MFTVVIPTMWRGIELQTMLPLLDEQPAIGEVLLINNEYQRTPRWFSDRTWKKVLPFAPKQNIYVNPAFNLAVHHSKYDQICLMQDDNLFDPLIFKLLEGRVTPSTGPIGCNQQHITRSNKIVPITNISVAPCRMDIPLQLGWASLIFLHKANWYPITDKLKIHHGEEWIVHYHLKRGLQPLVLVNFYLSTRSWKGDGLGGTIVGTTTSSSPEFRDVSTEDRSYYNSIELHVQSLFNT